MRVVARHATAEASALRMVRMNIPVAILASRGRAPVHVVRRMAARAYGMRWHLGLSEHEDVGVT